jgi:hypothetical protein
MVLFFMNGRKGAGKLQMQNEKAKLAIRQSLDKLELLRKP